MNDDLPNFDLEQLKGQHRRLDEEIRLQMEAGNGDPMELARLKKRKLRLKDQIQALMDESVPDIIA